MLDIKKTGLIILFGLLLLGLVAILTRSTSPSPESFQFPSPHSVVSEPADPTSAGSIPAKPVHFETKWLSGRILDTEGVGVAGATVLAFPATRSLRRCCMQAPSTPLTKTDPDGWFRFSNLHPGVELIAFKSVEMLVSRVVDTSGPHILTFPQGKFLEGIVQDEEGNPVKNALLRAYVRPDRAASLKMGQPVENKSDSNGSFRIGPVAPGTSVLLEATRPGYQVVRATVRVEASAAVSRSILTLKNGERLTGSIVSSDGTPLPGVLLTARQRDGVSLQVRSSADGIFEISGIGQGEVQLSAQLPGFAESTLSVPGTGNRVKIELRKIRSLQGKIASPRTGLYAVVVEGNSRYRTPVQSDGTFHFAHLSSGHVRILIESEDRNILASRRVVLDGTPANLSISLP